MRKIQFKNQLALTQSNWEPLTSKPAFFLSGSRAALNELRELLISIQHESRATYCILLMGGESASNYTRFKHLYLKLNSGSVDWRVSVLEGEDLQIAFNHKMCVELIQVIDRLFLDEQPEPIAVSTYDKKEVSKNMVYVDLLR